MAAREQAHALAHRADVGRDVDGVGHHQQAHQRQREPARAHLGDVGAQALSGDPADARRQHLDADHQRRGQQQRPHQAEAELRADLRIGGDAARVVVGGAGDEAGAQSAGEAVDLAVEIRVHAELPRAPGRRLADGRREASDAENREARREGGSLAGRFGKGCLLRPAAGAQAREVDDEGTRLGWGSMACARRDRSADYRQACKTRSTAFVIDLKPRCRRPRHAKCHATG